MKKIIFSLIIMFSFVSSAFADEQSSKGCFFPKGSFYRGIMQSTISSDFNNQDDPVRIINPYDVFIGKKLCIPKNTVYEGKISFIQPSKQGTDGALSVKIDYMILPSLQKIPFNAMIWTKRNGIIGGEASARSSYRTVLHRSVGLDPGVSVMVPYGNGVMGAETIKKAGEEVNLILNEDVFIKFLN